MLLVLYMLGAYQAYLYAREVVKSPARSVGGTVIYVITWPLSAAAFILADAGDSIMLLIRVLRKRGRA